MRREEDSRRRSVLFAVSVFAGVVGVGIRRRWRLRVISLSIKISGVDQEELTLMNLEIDLRRGSSGRLRDPSSGGSA